MIIELLTTFDQRIAEYFNNWTVDGWPVGNLYLVLIAVMLALLLCGTVGFERELRGRSAGLRTHLLVGMGSCIVMIISIYGFPAGQTRDVARLAAQVVSGVGFLGAGTIIYRNAGIKGLTTAGTIWISMAIGLACGSMNFLLAILATTILMFVLIGLRGLEGRINKRRPTFVVQAPATIPILAQIMRVSDERNCNLTSIHSERFDKDGVEMMEIYFKINIVSKDSDAEVFLEALRARTDATTVQLLEHH
ncbi:MAG: MgtC/SapB family protein [Bacilli bacterium]|nr:MgtC/SapB family protein [Bacilli bacterium]